MRSSTAALSLVAALLWPSLLASAFLLPGSISGRRGLQQARPKGKCVCATPSCATTRSNPVGPCRTPLLLAPGFPQPPFTNNMAD